MEHTGSVPVPSEGNEPVPGTEADPIGPRGDGGEFVDGDPALARGRTRRHHRDGDDHYHQATEPPSAGTPCRSILHHDISLRGPGDRAFELPGFRLSGRASSQLGVATSPSRHPYRQ